MHEQAANAMAAWWKRGSDWAIEHAAPFEARSKIE
jgi:hypothetical protein